MRFCAAIICTFCWFSNVFCSDFVLQERLKLAKNGDYIVTESNQMISLLAIRSITDESLILEEISAPLSAFNPRPSDWSEWVRHSAPGHSSWSMIEIELTYHQLIECYSFSRSAWMQLSPQESLISTLLNLSLRPLAKNDQRRIGPAPLNDDMDTRKIWKPPLIVDGKPLPDIEFDVFQTTWPEDGTDLAGNSIVLYFDHGNHSPFPAWMQIDTTHASASMRMIDSGHDLPVLHESIPRRIPEFIGGPQKTPSGIQITIKSPKYFRSFELFAVDVTSKEKQVFPIPHTLDHREGEELQIEILQSELQNVFQADHRYRWLIVPNGHSECYAESAKSFLWK